MFTHTDIGAFDPVVTTNTLRGSALVKTYPGAEATPALDGVDLTVTSGESVAIMGPSGSGKTTLLHVLAGVLAPTSGQVVWRGRDLAAMGDAGRTRLRRTDFGFVFQSGHLLPELPAVENAALPLMLSGVSRREATRRAEALLAPLGLSGLSARRPGELSGGQAQRVAIARALVCEPGVVFADEPTGALDQGTSAEVLEQLVTRCRAVGASLVVVTHDENVASWCERTVRLRDGRIVSDARTTR
ncbi:ABC transporter ATP-binding protein [Mobilicoccus caccae]|uniref:ABC transporter ATP-binding protein n=1 Tax=Mobilicoccus caccae TaxID=1859295 RepID=A0ABQ6ITP3_9MICO|nr:ABC transporter ATP-binding protein [Mobilicoccus caccae]GMA40087.1 ABC transporter ATP-binding protein [Mobilicoccus caccae]